MRKLSLITLMLLSVHLLQAQYPGYAPVKDEKGFKNDFADATQKIHTIQSGFVQVKELSMLAEKITSKGKFWFKKNNKVRMEYTEPIQYLMVINNDKVYVKDNKKESSVSARSNKIFQQLNRIMIDCMQGTTLNNPDFKSRIFENKNNWLVELVPMAKGLKDMFKYINVVVDKKDYVVSSIEMMELSGDNTIIRFTSKVVNTNIQDALFIIR